MRLLRNGEVVKMRVWLYGTEKKFKVLKPGTSVRILDPVTKYWEPATVNREAEEPSSHYLTNSSGTVLRRNRQHIRDAPPIPATTHRICTSLLLYQ